jgi:arsenate reductase
MEIKIYHNPKCKKSRAGVEYLSSKGINFQIVDYPKKGVSKEDLREILLKLNVRPMDLIRTNEEIYKKQFKSKNFNDEEWIQIIQENPRLLRRPIIIGKYKAVIGDPVTNIDKIIK